MRHLSALLIVLLMLIGLVGSPPAAEAAQTAPVVHGVMFWMEGCAHCHEVLENVLPPLQQQYGDSLDIHLIELKTSEDFDRLLVVGEAYGFASHEVGVPFLIISDTALVGTDQIRNGLPQLIDSHLAAGGVGFPDIPTLELEPAGETGAVAEAPPVEEEVTGGLRWNGFRLAVAIMAGMVAALIYAGISLWRSVGSGHHRPQLRWADYAFVPLAVAGLGVAAYLAYVETQTVSAICGPVGDCNAVQMSPYAKLFGVLPIGVLGVIGYTVMLALWAWGRLRQDAFANYTPVLLFGMALFGVLFSLYLTYLEPFVIGAVCIWCLTSAVIMTLLLLLTVHPTTHAMSEMMSVEAK